jgi:hypothetical protein
MHRRPAIRFHLALTCFLMPAGFLRPPLLSLCPAPLLSVPAGPSAGLSGRTMRQAVNPARRLVIAASPTGRLLFTHRIRRRPSALIPARPPTCCFSPSEMGPQLPRDCLHNLTA